MDTMNPQEIKENILLHTPLIIKCARMSSGYGQADFAKLLGITQSTISKLESGILVPDAITWAILCQQTNIPLDSNYLGFIDLKENSKNKFRLSSQNPFVSKLIDKKYRENCNYNNRFIMPILNHLHIQLGTKDYQKALKSLKVDPCYFYRLDLQVNDNFIDKIQAKFFPKTSPEQLFDNFWSRKVHGSYFCDYVGMKHNSVKKVQYFVKHAKAYNCEFDYEIKDQTKKDIQLEVSPSTSKPSAFMNQYNISFLKHMTENKNQFKITEKESSWIIQVAN